MTVLPNAIMSATLSLPLHAIQLRRYRLETIVFGARAEEGIDAARGEDDGATNRLSVSRKSSRHVRRGKRASRDRSFANNGRI